MNDMPDMSFPLGSQVLVQGFPLPASSKATFDYNGKIGTVVSKTRVGCGLNNMPVYTYQVHFKDVQVPWKKLNPKSNKLEYGVSVSDAQNWFEEIFLVKVG